ncbi:MAG: hypothetical protein ACRD1P_08505 [Thermoanaerobaculia bacterium]
MGTFSALVVAIALQAAPPARLPSPVYRFPAQAPLVSPFSIAQGGIHSLRPPS